MTEPIDPWAASARGSLPPHPAPPPPYQGPPMPPGHPGLPLPPPYAGAPTPPSYDGGPAPAGYSQQYPQQYRQPYPQIAYGGYGPARMNSMAIAALVVGVAGFVMTGVLAIVAIPLGHVALSQIKKTGERGRGLAIGGLVVGYVALAGTILVAGLIALLSWSMSSG